MPALRIGRARVAPSPVVDAPSTPGAPDTPGAPEVASPPPPALARAPWYLRLLRLAVGLTLLVLAWCGVLGITLLARSALRPVPAAHAVLASVVAVLKLGAACWVGIATLACIIAGAFSLSLALTHRDWR
jgi:hypothetical protein